MATTGAGTSLDYHFGRRLKADLRHRIADLYNTDTSKSNPKSLSQWTPGQLCVCTKKSATAPGDRAGDYPLHLGDFCIHYNASGVYTGVYVCTNLTITAAVVAACTWTALSITDGD